MKQLSRSTKTYILLSIIVGLAFSVHHFIGSRLLNPWLIGVAIMASLAQILKVEGATNKTSYNIAWVIYGFAFILFGPAEALFVIIFSHVVEWLWHKYPWYVQLFNIATYVIATSVADAALTYLNPETIRLSIASVTAIGASLAVFTLLNHLMVGLVIFFARGQTFRESGVFGLLTLAIDYTLISMGAGAAILWLITPTAAIFALIPLYLVYSTMKVPALERQSEIDPKTKLFNAKYFYQALGKEMNRADRFERPLTVVMGDMDLLRNINNTYGHVAGDLVLIGIAGILKEHFRGYDIVARFGGEEFAVILPETTPEQAYPRIEKVRKAIEARGFEVSTSVTPINVTMSFGISGRISHSLTPEELVHNADMALYHSKNNGRNQVTIHSEQGLQEFFGLKSEEAAEEPKQDSKREEHPAEPKREAAPPAPGEDSRPMQLTKQKVATAPDSRYSDAKINAYIGFTAGIAVLLGALLVQPDAALDWLGLALFALSVMLAEIFSIEIYSKEATVSTSAVPFIGGLLLFGPAGALVLSLVMAVVAYFKKRTQLKRLLFNLSNQLVAGLLVSALGLLLEIPFPNQPAYIQMALAIFAGLLVFCSTTLLLAVAIGISLEKPASAVWKEQFQWLFLYYLGFGVAGYALVLAYQVAGLVGMLSLLVPLWTLRVSQSQYISRTEGLVAKLRAKNREMTTHREEITTLNEELLVCLSQAIDIRDSSTYGHSELASHYAVQIAQELGLPAERVERIRKAALLHDIGKLGIPEGILFKPARLTRDEYEKIKQHPVIGADLVAQSHAMREIVPAIRYHHERWDGGGYPDGLHGNQIPLEARIVGLADAVEAMASDRPYRKGLRFEEIIREVKDNSGTQFDPAIVDAFIKIVGTDGEEMISNQVPSWQTESVMIK